MFSLCKTVKIYQTVNHYHNPTPSTHPHSQHHELQFEESLRPSKLEHSRTRTNDTHPRRYGIHLSLRPPSPARLSASDSRLPDFPSSQSGHDSLKLRSSGNDCDSPLIVESKITWGEISPRLKHYHTQERPMEQQTPSSEPLQLFPLQEQDIGLSFIPLRKQPTRTTNASVAQESLSGSHKLENEFSPLKKSGAFLRSASRSRLQDSARPDSLRNTVQCKLAGSWKGGEGSESLLRLSCSSYTQLFERGGAMDEQFSQTCSLELKKEGSSFLRDLVQEVGESVILGKVIPEKEMKIVKSNNDLLYKHSRMDSQDFKPTLSNVIERQAESPVKRLQKRYGQNLLHPYDKETIVSKSFTSRQSCRGKPIIDESLIIEHEITTKFQPLGKSAVNKPFYRLLLARETSTGMLVATKQIPTSRMDRLNEQLNVYRQIDSLSLEVEVARLYQLYTHGGVYVMVKEPHQYTLQQYIQKQKGQITSWDFLQRSLEDSLRRTASALSSRGIKLVRLVSSEDWVCVLGEWKLHSPDMFSGQGEAIQVEQAVDLLRAQVLGRIGEGRCAS